MRRLQGTTNLWTTLLVVWVIILGLEALVAAFWRPTDVTYSAFKERVVAGDVEEVVLSESDVRGTFRPPPDAKEGAKGEAFAAVRVDDPGLVPLLESKGVVIRGVRETSAWQSGIMWFAILAAVVLFAAFFRKRLEAMRSGVLTIGQNKAKVYVEKSVNVSFDDVAGADEAVSELREVVEFLQSPSRFTRLGGKLPKGILLVGPPGTGKTLLARAVAGEAAVPFFSISGSDFVEMFVGVGAARVRDLFEQAKSKAPCIVFIDELDALGKARGIGPVSNEEREQTLNQLLVEMDGFDARVGVILMAATNRPEILDTALLRPGRFDRHIVVDRPDKRGRLAILKLHTRTVPMAADIDLGVVAGMTAGFSGADLANIVNEASLLAVRRELEAVGTVELVDAVERVIAGPEKRNRVLKSSEKQRVAVHEVGHAVVALTMPTAERVHKISIIPRGVAALGYTLQLPTEDRFLLTRSELLDKMAILLGGRAAEELVFHEISTGAHDDISKATDLARSMVLVYGMDDAVGQVRLAGDDQPQFMAPRGGASRGDYSEATAREIDCAVRALIDDQYARVQALLSERKAAVEAAAAYLLEHEVITGEELAQVLERGAVVEPGAGAA